jgi:hypothetical protein
MNKSSSFGGLMRRFSALLVAAGLIACGGDAYDDAEVDGMATGITLTDVAGTWNLTGTLATEEATVIKYSVVATDSETGWLLNLPDRDPIEIRIVAIDGDSIVGESGPFPSILREGVMVTTRTVLRLQGEMLMGTLDATYDTDPVQMVPGTFEGTRAMP